jgi:hypothetical protein
MKVSENFKGSSKGNTTNDIGNALDPTKNGVTKEIDSNSESSKIVLSIVYALIISTLALILITNDMVALPFIIPVIPTIAYLVSLGLSSLYEQSMCNKVSIGQIAISNILIFLTTLLVTSVLYVEQLPILRFMFGNYNPAVETPESNDKKPLKDPEAHYKIQFFINVVKAVLPRFVSEENSKLAFVYFYWIFWATILPFFFLLSVQGLCK